MHWKAVRMVHAPPERVFRVVADPEEFNRVIPDGAGVEYLGPARGGVGTKFRASRRHKGKIQAFDQEITAFVPGKLVRMVNVTHGTRWDGQFQVEPGSNGATVFTLTMDAVTDRLLPRLMMPLIRGMLQKALEKDVDAVKSYCER